METRTATSLKTGTLVRSAQLDRAGLNKEKRTITVRFSTETPVRRWFGEETLSHDSGAVKLDRMKNGAAVLMEHDANQRCGITESASIIDKNGEAVVRFARTPLGDQCMNEVEDGTLRWVSVGYVVNRFEVNDKEDQYRAIDWEPLEVSFVGIPADPNARVLRSNNTDTHESIVMKRSILLDPVAPTQGGTIAAPTITTKEDFTRQLDEAQEIIGVQAQYMRTHPEVNELCVKALKDKMPIREFYQKVSEIALKPKTETATIVASDPKAKRAASGSIGQRFVESEAYKAALTRGIKRGNHFAVEIPELNSFQQRATFSLSVSDISGSADIGGTGGTGIDIRPQFNLLNQQPLALTNLFGQGTTSGDQVRIVRELTFTNSAARVGEGGNKPEGQLDVGVVNFTVEKTAVFLNVTEEMLADQAQAASFVNGRLAYMVGAKEDDYVINGTGSSQITGILNTSGIQTLSAASNTLDQFKVGKAYVEGANNSGYVTPDAYVMNPLDWLSASLTKDGNGQYLFGGPGYSPYGVGGYSNVSMMWGLPVVTSAFVTRGTAFVGAFKQGGQVARRAGITIRTTDSHASNFIANITTVLAESRFALVIYQPNNFLSFTGIPA